jgi:hypothetical protein
MTRLPKRITARCWTRPAESARSRLAAAWQQARTPATPLTVSLSDRAGPEFYSDAARAVSQMGALDEAARNALLEARAREFGVFRDLALEGFPLEDPRDAEARIRAAAALDTTGVVVSAGRGDRFNRQSQASPQPL